MKPDAAPPTSARPTRAHRVAIASAFRTCPGARSLESDPEALLDRGERVAGGRRTNVLLSPREWGQSVRVRPGQRGGLLGPLLGARYATPTRPLRELALVEALHAEGVPVAAPVFAAAWRQGVGWRTAFATVEQEGDLDLAVWLARAPDEGTRVTLAVSIARALRRVHDAGVVHGDLQIRNLLVDARRDPPTCTVIDFDRARRSASVSAAVRLREWMRLVRSCDKTGHATQLTPRVQAAALSAYCGGDRGLRRALLGRLPREQARMRRHRLGWRIGGFFGRGAG